VRGPPPRANTRANNAREYKPGEVGLSAEQRNALMGSARKQTRYQKIKANRLRNAQLEAELQIPEVIDDWYMDEL